MFDRGYSKGTEANDTVAVLVPEHMASAVQKMVDELARALKKHPRGMQSAHEGYAVIAEELDEMWDEVKADRPDLALKEAAQVSAMGLRYLVDMAHGRMVA